MKNEVLLVDEQDKPIKMMDKLKAHQSGELHRAFSIFIFNSKNQLLLQKRADTKYHAAGLWTNSCCSHPISESSILAEASERLEFEMGIKQNDLNLGFSFIYQASFENGLKEHEFDHVIYGFTDDLPRINEDEVSEYRYVYFEDLIDEIEKNPEKFTPWFLLCYERIFSIAVLREDEQKENLNNIEP